MKPHGHGSKFAIALAVTAVVIAGTGTAVAVTSSSVNIADPTTPTRIAHVDNTGRLTTAPALSGIVTTNLLIVPSGFNYITSPTSASLALTKLTLSAPSINSTATFAEVRYYLYETTVTGGSCGTSILRALNIWNVAPGDDVVENFPSPLAVGPVGGQPYCLALYAATLGGTYSAGYYPSYSLTAFVTAGSYTGIGTPASAALSPAQIQTRERTAAAKH